MLNFYPNQKLFRELTGGRHLKNRWDEAVAARMAFNMQQEAFANQMRHANVAPHVMANQAALLPDDAWREVDSITERVLRDDEGQVYMDDLMGIARGVDIGKTAHVYRTSSDTNARVNVSMNGQEPTLKDKVQYDFNGHPIPIFDTGYGLNWREWRGQQSENFDGITDDQEAAVASLEEAAADYVLDGDSSINVGGYEGYGIKNHPDTNIMDLDASGFNIDLTSFSTTADAIEDFFVRDFQQVLHDNLVRSPVTIYISTAMKRRFDRSYSGSGGFKGGSLLDFLKTLDFIADIKMTYKLSGNEFMAFPLVPRYIRPLVGMATTTIAIPRATMMDDYNFKVAKALGIEIRADANGKSGVIYAAEIA